MLNVGSVNSPAPGEQVAGTVPGDILDTVLLLTDGQPAVAGDGGGRGGTVAIISPQDNATGLSSVGPQLETNSRLGGVWQESAGAPTTPPASDELISNLDTKQLEKVYGGKAEAIHVLGEQQSISVRTATNLATGPLAEVKAVVSHNKNIPISNITGSGGATLTSDVADGRTAQLLQSRPDISPMDLQNLMTSMQMNFRGHQGAATEAYEMALNILKGTKARPTEIADMIGGLFDAPKANGKLTGSDVLDMVDEAQGLMAGGATPADVIDKFCGANATPIGQLPDSPQEQLAQDLEQGQAEQHSGSPKTQTRPAPSPVFCDSTGAHVENC